MLHKFCTLGHFKHLRGRLFSTQNSNTGKDSFMKRWLGPLPEYPRWSGLWYKEKIIQGLIFAVAGSSSLYFVRPMVKNLGFSSTSIFEMTWPEKFLSVCILTPCYTGILLSIGTACGRYQVFKPIVVRMWSRFPVVGKIVASKLK